MYTNREGICPHQPPMRSQQRFQLAVAGTVFLSALSLGAQSARTADMDAGGTITSLTDLKSRSHPPVPFGAIDASTENMTVQLDVSMQSADQSTSEIGSQSQSGKLSGQSLLKGSLASPSQYPNSLQAKNLQGTKDSGLSATTSLARTPSAKFSTSPSSQLTSPSASSTNPSSVSTSPSRQPLLGSKSALEPRDKSQGDSSANIKSASNAPPALKASGLSARRAVYSGRDFLQSPRSLSDFSSSRSHQFALGSHPLPSSSPDAPPGASADHAESLDNADNIDVDAATTESNGVSEATQEPTGFFESVKDPFADQLKSPFKGTEKPMQLERPCGDACLPEGSSRQSGDFTSESADTSDVANGSDSGDRLDFADRSDAPRSVQSAARRAFGLDHELQGSRLDRNTQRGSRGSAAIRKSGTQELKGTGNLERKIR